jgi:Ca-activated chloride channel family protein
VRIALPAAAASLLALAAPGAGQPSTHFRGGVELVTIGATVVDRRGVPIADLGRGEFEVREDGVPQMLRYFAAGAGGDEAPELHLGLLLDVSASMADDLSFTRTAAIRFVTRLDDAVDVTLVDFDAAVRVARYARRDHPRLVERIRSQPLGRFTALYDAIGVYLDGAAEQMGRSVMLLYTDGGDTRSALRLPELLDLLRASSATVFVIGAPQRPGGNRWDERASLEAIAAATGGEAFFPASPKELDRVYARVLAAVRAQYTLGYVSTNDRRDGAWRKVELRVTRSGLDAVRIHARGGYFAPLGR